MAELARKSGFDTAHWALPGVEVSVSALACRRLLVGSVAAVSAALGAEVPQAPNTVVTLGDGRRCLWLRPDQWLLLGEGALVPVDGVWVLEVSSRYAGLSLRGAGAAALLAAGCGLDLRLRQFPAGQCARTRIDQVPALLWRAKEDHFEVLVERPLAHYFGLWLQRAAE